MSLSVIQLRRAPVRTALLVVVVAALVFLVEYLATLSATLQAFSTGALAHLPADLIVYSRAAEGSLDASRLPPRSALRAAGVPGVSGCWASTALLTAGSAKARSAMGVSMTAGQTALTRIPAAAHSR